MTSKQRAYLISLASKEQTIIYIGKSGITPELTASVEEALEARELIKIGIQQNCLDLPAGLAETLSGRTNSTVIQVIGRKIVLYREGKGKKRKLNCRKHQKEDDPPHG